MLVAAIPGDQACPLLRRDEDVVLLLAPKESAGNSRKKASALVVTNVLTFTASKPPVHAEKSKDKPSGKGKGNGNDKGSGGSTKRGASPSGAKDRYPCRFYTAGKCHKGNECEYWHIPVCRFHKQGTCEKGGICLFLHAAVSSPAEGADADAVAEQTKQKPKPKVKPSAENVIAVSTFHASVSPRQEKQ